MREPQNCIEVAALSPNYMGFIFYEKSPRFVADLSPDIIHKLAKSIEKVAVFVNETENKILEIAKKYNITTLQLHGNESPEFCQLLRKQGFTIFKAFNISNVEDINKISLYENYIDFALLDAKGQQLGGNGTTFDWNLLDNYNFSIPFFLSGGISAENIAMVLAIKHPKLYGIDVNSKFELTPALKNIEQLKTLFHYCH